MQSIQLMKFLYQRITFLYQFTFLISIYSGILIFYKAYVFGDFNPEAPYFSQKYEDSLMSKDVERVKFMAYS